RTAYRPRPPERAGSPARSAPARRPRSRPACVEVRRRRISIRPAPSHSLANDLDDPRRLDVRHDALDPGHDEIVPPPTAIEEYADSRPRGNDRHVKRVHDLASETLGERGGPVGEVGAVEGEGLSAFRPRTH